MSTPAAVVAGLVEDLRAERDALLGLLRTQPEDVWSLPTPAAGWSVHDEMAHLAFFDGVTRTCIAEPTVFARFRDVEMGDLQTYVDAVGPRHAHLSGAEMLDWWERESEGLLVAAAAADPTTRVPWFGPSMSLASKLTARIMETWAHGQDVYDALGERREPTQRLRHVARIGVLALPNSYRTRGRAVPDVPVLVDLEAPDGARWSWGDPTAEQVVQGPAEDFCLVVTQRRHVADTTLETRGDVAAEWMTLAQAFAGPAGAGREPGQFSGLASLPASAAGA